MEGLTSLTGLPYMNSIFSLMSEVFLFMPQNIWIHWFFANTSLRKIKDHSLWTEDFKNFFCLQSLKYLSTLSKNIFKCISKVFWRIVGRFPFCWCRVEKDQRSQFENKNFSKINFAIEIFGGCLPDMKKYFQLHKSIFFVLGHKILG